MSGYAQSSAGTFGRAQPQLVSGHVRNGACRLGAAQSSQLGRSDEQE